MRLSPFESSTSIVLTTTRHRVSSKIETQSVPLSTELINEAAANFFKLPTLPALQLMTMALVFLSLLLRLLTLLALSAKGALCTVSRTACGARDLANFTSS